MTTACFRACAVLWKAMPTIWMTRKKSSTRRRARKTPKYQSNRIRTTARKTKHAPLEFFGGAVGLAVGSAATRRGRDDRLARQRYVGHGNEPSGQAVYADIRRGPGRSARTAEGAGRVRRALHARRGLGPECHRALKSYWAARCKEGRLCPGRYLVQQVAQGSPALWRYRRGGEQRRAGRCRRTRPGTLDVVSQAR